MPDDLQRDCYTDALADELVGYPDEQADDGYEGEQVDEDNEEAPIGI